MAASSGDLREVEVSIIRWVDDEPQPEIIEFVLSDRSGRQWHFHEECAVISGELVDAASVYPNPAHCVAPYCLKAAIRKDDQ
ncbi:hypothetical protein IG197_17960 [Aminobacter sp. SR38]|uniref:hypothetical protein n=1 Tax=Aminobacter sp. SR38 TaxID=2774562 RepID=UPI0017831B0E|nr:hypothetical protein [Aminobacter sp. SR38]QOF69731.1 hypothetical protein IG197_17960 [Aminobacter sp. SR38]